MICLAVGCKKDADSDTQISSNNTEPLKSMGSELVKLYEQVPAYNFGNITLVNGDILKFQSFAHYEQVYEYLYDQYCAWTRIFLETYYTEDEDDLDATVERLNFDDRMPMMMFEDQFGLSGNTLRSMKAIDEDNWLANGTRGAAPVDNIINCPVEQALYSKYHEICIQDTVYQSRPDGYMILIPLSDIRFIGEIRRMSMGELVSRAGSSGGQVPLGIGDVIIVKPYPDYCYQQQWYKSDWQDNNYCPCYKFSWSYNFRNTNNNITKKATATMANYKLKNNEWVKDYGSYCKLSFSTKIYKLDCIHDECLDVGRDGKEGSITMVHSKSKNKTFLEWVYDDTYSSYIICRHKGIDFKFSARGYLIAIL
jgi:hypothetical protein